MGRAGSCSRYFARNKKLTPRTSARDARGLSTLLIEVPDVSGFLDATQFLLKIRFGLIDVHVVQVRNVEGESRHHNRDQRDHDGDIPEHLVEPLHARIGRRLEMPHRVPVLLEAFHASLSLKANYALTDDESHSSKLNEGVGWLCYDDYKGLYYNETLLLFCQYIVKIP